ncbi:hypothetical protein [Bacillus thuringiensis]|uniref:hypothetical protein n=1 Tax=Bacillus thuringiensis TaxID=1428 RepID=UPI000BF3186B|nr:hypothetical protein [Bacillus thuringiensis]PFL02908.1 hypothetical protein COJ28_27495 [Bacillus thuringiensis]PGU42965.1 hypothetical protein COD63_12125 [Bacillus thuringiensis]
MKKVFAVFFVLALAFMSINSSTAMAYGGKESHLYLRWDDRIMNYVFDTVPLYNGPGNPNVVGYVADQPVTVKQAWFLINTSLGPKWIGYNDDETALPKNYFAYDAKLRVTGTRPLYNGPGNPNIVGYVAWQDVTVKQAWYLIDTSLGQKWIGYNVY